MIFIDASALTAIIADEPAAEPLVRCLESDATFFTSGIAIYETALAVARIANCSVAKALSDVHDLVSSSSVSIEAIDAAHAEQALVAFARFGKGRHPAALNMGDCFAYASAKLRDAAILFVGQDFARTDLRSALSSS